jgi:hypothetical protein
LFLCDFKIQISHLVHVCACYSILILGTVGSKRYGIAKNVNLIAVKVMNSRGRGSWCGVIAGIDWVIRQPRPNGAVINMSLGSTYVFKPVDDAVEAAVQAGVHVVVAAGNSNRDACGASPASAVNAITVGATGQDDARAYFSNYGGCLDMFAPGVAIHSTYVWNGYYAIGSGTSMAAPHVAGVAALLLQEDPTLTPAQLTQRMRADATAGIVTSEQAGSPNLLLNTEAINERAPSDSASAATLAPSLTPTTSPAVGTSPTSPGLDWELEEGSNILIGPGSYYTRYPVITLVDYHVTNEVEAHQFIMQYEGDNPVVMWQFHRRGFFICHRLSFMFQHLDASSGGSPKDFVNDIKRWLTNTGRPGNDVHVRTDEWWSLHGFL